MVIVTVQCPGNFLRTAACILFCALPVTEAHCSVLLRESMEDKKKWKRERVSLTRLAVLSLHIHTHKKEKKKDIYILTDIPHN